MDHRPHPFGIGAPFHGIEDLLRAALSADPQAIAAHARQGLDDLFIQPVLARDRLERQAESAPLHLGGVLEQPFVVDGENVVGVPQHVRGVGRHDLRDLVDHVGRRPPPV